MSEVEQYAREAIEVRPTHDSESLFLTLCMLCPEATNAEIDAAIAAALMEPQQ